MIELRVGQGIETSALKVLSELNTNQIWKAIERRTERKFTQCFDIPAASQKSKIKQPHSHPTQPCWSARSPHLRIPSPKL